MRNLFLPLLITAGAFVTYRTIKFVPAYISLIWKGFMKFKSASIGMPIGFIIGLQRIIQISETSLGTSALASPDGENSPRREALLQTFSTVLIIFIAVVITLSGILSVSNLM